MTTIVRARQVESMTGTPTLTPWGSTVDKMVGGQSSCMAVILFVVVLLSFVYRGWITLGTPGEGFMLISRHCCGGPPTV